MRRQSLARLLMALVVAPDLAVASFAGGGTKASSSNDTVVLVYRLSEVCLSNTGCVWSQSIPLTSSLGGTTNYYTHARAYLAGWHYASFPTAGGWKTQVLEIGIKNQSLRTVGSTTFLDIDIAFAALSTPHDGDEVTIDIEVLATRMPGDVEIVSLVHSFGDVGTTVVSETKSLASSLPFAVAPVSYFKMSTDMSGGGAPVGSNLSVLKLETSAVATVGGVDSTVTCDLTGDHVVLGTQTTSCEVDRTVVFAKTALVVRAPVQPFVQMTVGAIPAATPFVTTIGGTGVGSPVCGLGSFSFEESAAGAITSLQVRELGVIASDCDSKVLQRGIPALLWLDGRYCWEKWSGTRVGTQSPGMPHFPMAYPMEGCTDEPSAPAVRQGLHLTIPGTPDDRLWKGLLRLETAGLL